MGPPAVRLTERFNQAVLPMMLVALDGTLMEANESGCRLLGRTREQLVGLPFEDLAVDGKGEVLREAAQRAMLAGEVGGQIERRLSTADGTPVDVQVAWTLLRDDQGEPSYTTLVLVDVTEGRRSQAALARAEARGRARFEQSSVPQTLVDLDGALAAVNAAFCALLGMPADALVGRSLQSLTHPQDGGEAGAQLARVLDGELDTARYERLVTDGESRALPTLVDVTLLRDAEGRPVEVAAVVYDLRRLRDLERRREQQDQFFLAVSQHASDVALVADADGQILFASAATRDVAGYEPAELVARVGWEFVHPDDVDAARAIYESVVTSGGTGTFRVRIRTADGSWRWFEETVTNMLETPIEGIVANLRDITERVEAEQALQASEAWYRAIAETAEEGIWAVSPHGVTHYANNRMAAIFGLPLAEVHGQSVHELFPPGDAAEIMLRLSGRAAVGPERYEVGYHAPDGAERRLWISASPLPDGDGVRAGSLKMVSDVTEVRRGEEQLRRAALHDALTGLPNRTLLRDRLDQAVARRDAGTGSVAVLLLDLDGFKLVNDSRGHGTGDVLLLEVAARLLAHARPADTVARLGGDEFVLVCEDVDEAGAQQLAAELHETLGASFHLAGRDIHVTASVGIAVSPAAAGEDLLRFADAAMYAAKAAGRGRSVLFDRTLADAAERQHTLSAELRQALDDDELRLHYQPVVELSSGRVVGMEALARWLHPVHGELPPGHFVPVAEQTGLSGRLDSWALRRAARDLADLRSRGLVDDAFSVAVNLSVHSLGDPGLEEQVVAAVEGAGLPASAVSLEITESAIMADAERAVRLLGRLRARGFGIAIDDFGTGYSSLAYLRDLPVNVIKIDRSFVAEIVEDRDALAIVASVVDLARAVGVTAVAEGVETAEQGAVLRGLGCALGQGWLWAPALGLALVEQEADTWRSGYPVGPVRPARTPHEQPDTWKVLPEHGAARLLELHGAGASLSTIAAALNGEGFRTPAGARWHRTTVARTVAQVAYPDLAGPA